MMKSKIYLKAAFFVVAAGAMTSCNDYLEKEPVSQIRPDEYYFNQAPHLEAYCNML